MSNCNCTPVRGIHAIFCPENARNSPAKVQFVGVMRNVMQGARCVAVACSHTMAKRIARALNLHKPNERGY